MRKTAVRGLDLKDWSEITRSTMSYQTEIRLGIIITVVSYYTTARCRTFQIKFKEPRRVSSGAPVV